MDDDDDLLDPTGCGRSVRVLSSGFLCLVTGDHDEHVWRGPAQSSRGMGYADDREVEVEVRWRDDRPPATVGDQRRLIVEVEARRGLSVEELVGAPIRTLTTDPKGR